MSALYQQEPTTLLTNNSTFTGSARDAYGIGANAGTSVYSAFSAQFYADQTGTASVESSPDGVTWSLVEISAVAPSLPVILNAPIQGQFYRAKLLNTGSTQGTLVINTGFTNTTAGT